MLLSHDSSRLTESVVMRARWSCSRGGWHGSEPCGNRGNRGQPTTVGSGNRGHGRPHVHTRAKSIRSSLKSRKSRSPDRVQNRACDFDSSSSERRPTESVLRRAAARAPATSACIGVHWHLVGEPAHSYADVRQSVRSPLHAAAAPAVSSASASVPPNGRVRTPAGSCTR